MILKRLSQVKKILIVSTVSRQFYLFEQANIEVLKSLGFEVHAAANYEDANERINDLDIIKHHFDIQRSPYSYKNIKAYKQLKKIIEAHNFNAIHCHSPMGGVLARLAAKSLGISPVIYTAHGFHFYKGAPIINWLLYYPVEKWLSRYTDALITINQEDYHRAKKLLPSSVFFVPGIGVDPARFKPRNFDRNRKRAELGIGENTVALLSIGEMIKRKNHESVLRAISKLKNENFICLICGKGELEEQLKKLSRDLKISQKIRFLGYRNDIPEVCLASDIFIFPSYQEGLPVAVMEAMSAGLPVVCSAIRGNVDLIKDGVGGFVHNPNDIDGFAKSIEQLIFDSELRKRMGRNNKEVVKQYDKHVVKEIMNELYTMVLK